MQDKKKALIKKSRLDLLGDWSEEHISHYPDCEKVTLFRFKIDKDAAGGAYSVKFDEKICPVRLGFQIQGNGLPAVKFPMTHSPLGVPCSYAQINISYKVTEAINRGLRQVLPSFNPLEIDRESDRLLVKRAHKEINVRELKKTLENSRFKVVVVV